MRDRLITPAAGSLFDYFVVVEVGSRCVGGGRRRVGRRVLQRRERDDSSLLPR